MAQINVAQLYSDIEPVMRNKWGMARRQMAKVFPKIFKVTSTSEPIMETLEMAGPGPLSLKTENAAVAMGGVNLGRPMRWHAATFAAGISASREAVMDSKTKELKSAAGLLGRATDKTPELLAAQFLDRSFDSNYPATWDGAALCSTSHSRVDGTTYGNAPTVAASFSESSIEDIRTALLTATGPDGTLDPLQIKTIVVAAANANLAEKLVKSEKTLGSANNDPSIVQDNVRGFVANGYLTNTTRYYALTDAEDGLFWKWREEPQFVRDNIALTQTAVFIAFFRAYWGCENPRAIWGVNAA